MVFQGSLPFLRIGMKLASEPVGDGAAQDEPARLDARHCVDGLRSERLGHLRDSRLEALSIAQQCRHVAEHDAALGVVRNCTD